MNIRLATPNDYEQVMGLYNDFMHEDLYSRHGNDSFQKVLENPASLIYVAEVDGKIEGFASMSMRSVVRYPAPIAQLEELYVAPEKRQHGIGKALVRQVESTAQENGCFRVYIESRGDLAAAHTFYQNSDYTNHGLYFTKNLT